MVLENLLTGGRGLLIVEIVIASSLLGWARVVVQSLAHGVPHWSLRLDITIISYRWLISTQYLRQQILDDHHDLGIR